MKSIHKKLTCFVLSIMFLLTACSSGDTSSSTGVVLNNGGGIEPTVVGTTGKYVQNDVTPDNIAQIYTMRQLDDARILLVGADESGLPVALVSKEGNAWESYTNSPAAQALSNISMGNVSDDGTWWLAVSAGEGQSKLYRGDPGGQVAEVSIAALAQNGTAFITDILLDENNVVVCIQKGESIVWEVLDHSGKTINTIAPPGYMLGSELVQGKIMAVAAGDNRVLVYDPATGKQESSTQLPYSPDALTASSFFFSEDQSLCHVSAAGIQRVAFGGEIIQSVIDERSYAYAGSGFGAMALLAAIDNTYWLGCFVLGAPHVYRYSYDDEAPLYEGNELKIWAMDDNQLMRTALSVYAQSNPGVEIIYELGHSAENGAITNEDIIRNLNTRLISGDAPDVLILDGLPIRSLIDKGMLSDISGIVNEEDYYSNILNAYTENGATYAYPTLFRPTIMVRQQGFSGPVLSSMQSIKDMEELLTQPALVRFGGYRNVFLNLYDGFAPSIFPNGTSVDEAALHDFLQVTDAIVEAHGLRSQPDDPVLGDGQDNFQGSGGEAYGINESVSLMWYTWGHDDGQAMPYGIGSLNSFYSSLLSLQQRPWPPEEMMPLPGGAYTPSTIASVPMDAQNKEGGKQFITTMLELQADNAVNRGVFSGFFVRRDINLADAVDAYENPQYGETSDPRLFDWDGLFAQFNTPNDIDLLLKEKLYDEAVKMYTGTQSVEQAVKAVLQQTELYFAERS